jgi:hypothetical protein
LPPLHSAPAPPLGAMEVTPGAPPHIPCGPLLEPIWYIRVRRRENVFRKNHYCGTEGGVCTILTHGHTKTAHISHIFSEAEPPAPCQTGLPCERSQTWNSISRALNSHVKTAYPVITFTQLTAEPPPPRPSPSKLFLTTLQPLFRATSRHLWRSVVCFPLSL